MDFIDLKFKQKLLNEKHPRSEDILNSDPLLRRVNFDRWKVTLLLAIQDRTDLHPMTLHQLNYLCKDSDNFKTIIKISNQPKMQE